jgi:hypothetical protein
MSHRTSSIWDDQLVLKWGTSSYAKVLEYWRTKLFRKRKEKAWLNKIQTFAFTQSWRHWAPLRFLSSKSPARSYSLKRIKVLSVEKSESVGQGENGATISIIDIAMIYAITSVKPLGSAGNSRVLKIRLSTVAIGTKRAFTLRSQLRVNDIRNLTLHSRHVISLYLFQ